MFHNTFKGNENYQKLLDIQSSLVSGKVFGASHPAILELASRDRIFISEIDLRKVCRKLNKLFRFWVFNDSIIYGRLNSDGKYLFHRKIDLATCVIQYHTSTIYSHALEITGAEKSFIVLASSDYEQMQFLNIVSNAIDALKGSPTSTSELNLSASFPIANAVFAPQIKKSLNVMRSQISNSMSTDFPDKSLNVSDVESKFAGNSSNIEKSNACVICNQV
jgi:hypothetical protein